jgi:ribosomal protein S8
MLLYSTLAILNQGIKNKDLVIKIPYSRKGFELIKIFYQLGYISSYYIDFNKINIEFKYYQNKFICNGFFFYTKPGHCKFITINQLRRLYKNKSKLYILSTPYGICTTLDALKMNTGGLLLIEIQ